MNIPLNYLISHSEGGDGDFRRISFVLCLSNICICLNLRYSFTSCNPSFTVWFYCWRNRRNYKWNIVLALKSSVDTWYWYAFLVDSILGRGWWWQWFSHIWVLSVMRARDLFLLLILKVVFPMRYIAYIPVVESNISLTLWQENFRDGFCAKVCFSVYNFSSIWKGAYDVIMIIHPRFSSPRFWTN